MRARAFVSAALGLMVAAPATVSADSVFGIRGLGILGRPLSARASSSAGAFSLFDGTSALNPGAFAQFGGPAGWAAMAATSRRFTDGSLAASLGSSRFPLFGFATTAGAKVVLGVTIGDYLDRTWSVSTAKDTLLRDSTITLNDQATSSGGVSDVQLAGAYRLSADVSVGLGLHTLVGSTRLTVVRTFSSAAFSDYRETATTEFSGVGVSAGMTARLGPRLALAASARLNGRLKAAVRGGSSATVALPVELGAAVLYAPSSAVGLAATAGYQSWSRAATDLVAAGQPGSRSVWNVAAGAELSVLRWHRDPVPLRLGYRWRQLPFPMVTASGTAPLSESAASMGLGLALAGGRATLDAGLEFGARSGGSARERFTTGHVGLTVRP
jgi:hypothetical protein